MEAGRPGRDAGDPAGRWRWGLRLTRLTARSERRDPDTGGAGGDRGRLALRLLALVALVAAVGVAGLRHQGSPSALLARKGRIVAVETSTPRVAGGYAYTDLVARSSSGLVVHARVRVPRVPGGPLPAAVLAGGLNRGRRVVGVTGLEAIARHVILISPDYGLDPRRRAWRGPALARTALGIRPAALDAVAGVALLLDYLESRPDVRRDALFLVGSSLGAPVVTIAGAIDPRPRAVAVLYGGGNLGSLIAHTMIVDERHPLPPWEAAIAGHVLAWWVAPLEPARYVAAISPRPLLMINGRDDSLIPRRNVTALYEAARPPKDLRWVEGEHVQPTEDDLIRRLAGIVAEWLAARGLLDRAGA